MYERPRVTPCEAIGDGRDPEGMRYLLRSLLLSAALASTALALGEHKHNHTKGNHTKGEKPPLEKAAAPKGEKPAATGAPKHEHTKERSVGDHKEKSGVGHVEHAAAAARAEALGSPKKDDCPCAPSKYHRGYSLSSIF